MTSEFWGDFFRLLNGILAIPYLFLIGIRLYHKSADENYDAYLKILFWVCLFAITGGWARRGSTFIIAQVFVTIALILAWKTSIGRELQHRREHRNGAP